MTLAKFTLILTLGAFAFIAPSHAALITGGISMSGNFSPTGGTDLATATGIDFTTDSFNVGNTTGDFVGVAGPGAIQDFDFAPILRSDRRFLVRRRVHDEPSRHHNRLSKSVSPHSERQRNPSWVMGLTRLRELSCSPRRD